MRVDYRWISRDLGKAEFVFAIVVISILLAGLVNKSLSLFALTERRLVEATVSNIQTALSIQTALKSVKKKSGDLLQLSDGMNPVNLMQSSTVDYKQYLGNELDYVKAKRATILPIANYLGEMFNPDIEALERGNWYFDHNGRLFIYLVEHKELFGVNSREPTELKYRVKLEYNDIDNDGLYEAGEEILNSASFVRIDDEK